MTTAQGTAQPTTVSLPKKFGLKAWISIAAVVVGVIVLLLPLPLSMLGKATLGLSIWMLVWAVATPIPGAYTALIYICALLILRYQSGMVWAMFTMSAGWFMAAAFVFAAAMMRSGLARRLAYTIMYTMRGNTVPRFLIASVVICLIMVLLIPSPIAMVAVLLPILGYVAEEWGLPARDAAKKGIPILAVLAASLLLLAGNSGFWLKTAFSQNLVSLSLAKVDVDFVDWFKYAGPVIWLASFAFVGLVVALFRPSKSIEAPIEMLRVKVKEMGPMTVVEKRVLAIMIIMFIGFATESLHKIPVGWISLIGVCLFAIPQFGIFKKFDEMLGSVNWGLMLFVTALDARAIAFGQSGITKMLTEFVSPLKPTTIPGFYLLANFFGTVVTGLVSLNVSQAVVVPLFTAWGQELGLNTAQSLLAIWLPAGTVGPNIMGPLLPTVLLALNFKYKGSNYFTFKDFVIVSLALFVAFLVVALAFEFVVWPLL